MKTAKQSNMRGVWSIVMIGAVLFGIGLLTVTGAFGPIDTLGKVFSWIFLLIGLGLLYLSYFTYRSNQKSYQEFYQLFPELNESMETVVAQASYVSEPMGVLIYKDYLVNYSGVGLFSFVPLRDVLEVSYRWVPRSRRRPAQAFLLVQLKNEDRVKHIEIVAVRGKSRNSLVEELYSYIHQHYQHIQFK